MSTKADSHTTALDGKGIEFQYYILNSSRKIAFTKVGSASKILVSFMLPLSHRGGIGIQECKQSGVGGYVRFPGGARSIYYNLNQALQESERVFGELLA